MNFYEVLGVPVNADQEDIKAAFRRLAKEWHPDRHADAIMATRKMQAINQAYQTLKDPQKRSQYDFENKLGFFAQQTPPPGSSQAKARPHTQKSTASSARPSTASNTRRAYHERSFDSAQKKRPNRLLILISLVGFATGMASFKFLLDYLHRL